MIFIQRLLAGKQKLRKNYDRKAGAQMRRKNLFDNMNTARICYQSNTPIGIQFYHKSSFIPKTTKCSKSKPWQSCWDIQLGYSLDNYLLTFQTLNMKKIHLTIIFQNISRLITLSLTL